MAGRKISLPGRSQSQEHPPIQILGLFPGEAALLAAAGGALGLVLGASIVQIVSFTIPAPVSTPWWFAVLAEGIATTVGLAAGVFPAHRAARMQPVDALRAE